jgi:hypothetical protein
LYPSAEINSFNTGLQQQLVIEISGSHSEDGKVAVVLMTGHQVNLKRRSVSSTELHGATTHKTATCEPAFVILW